MRHPKTPFALSLAGVVVLLALSRPAWSCMRMSDGELMGCAPGQVPETDDKAGARTFKRFQAAPAPAAGTTPTPRPAGEIFAGGTATGDLPSPTGPCQQNPSQVCYTEEELSRVADKIAKGNASVADQVRAVFAARTPGKDVEEDDVNSVNKFFADFATAKKAVEGFKPYLPAEEYAAIEGDPRKVWTARDNNIPPDVWKTFTRARHEMRQDMVEGMTDMSNPLHEGLMSSKDPWIASLRDGAPDQGGGSHPGSDDGPIHSGSEWQSKDQNNPAAYVYGAEQAAAGGDLAGTVAQASKALSLDPDNVRALDLRGAANYDLHNLDDAKADATKALTLDAGDKTAQAIMSLADGHAMNGSAAKNALAGLASTSSDSAVRAGTSKAAGLAALAATQPAEASASASETREALAALTVGDSARALRAADIALSSNPNNLQALNVRAMALLRQRRYNDALAAADAALAKDPKNRALQNTRAAALNKLHRYREAELQARALIEANPKDAAAWRSLSEALAGLGDRQGSLEALKRAAALDPRFNKTLETALQLPADADLNLLFADDLASGGASSAPAPSSRSSRKLRRFGLVVGAALAAGLMMFIGAAPALKRSMGEAWTRITRRGPSVGPAAQGARRATDLIKGQYRPGRQIGFGGMGTVYEGLDVNLQRTVAIKKIRDEIKSDPRERARFVQEAKLVAALHHPSIVDIYAIAEEADDVYLVFEYIKGKTLYDHVVSRGRLSLAEALPILRGVVDGLEYAHSRGIIHRDIKPSNIMLNEDGVKVMDFGIARVAKDALTKVSQVMTNTIVGTPPYMAPEQEQGLVRKESDVYALALCLYEMLTGRMAFAGTGAGMLMSKINKAYAPVTTLAPELPAELDAVFAAALEPEPGKRLSTPREFFDRAAAAAAGSRRS